MAIEGPDQKHAVGMQPRYYPECDGCPTVQTKLNHVVWDTVSRLHERGEELAQVDGEYQLELTPADVYCRKVVDSTDVDMWLSVAAEYKLEPRHRFSTSASNLRRRHFKIEERLPCPGAVAAAESEEAES